MELVKRPHARNLVRWAAPKPDVVVLSADLTASCEADDFREACPERFFSLGMTEHVLLGHAEREEPVGVGIPESVGLARRRQVRGQHDHVGPRGGPANEVRPVRSRDGFHPLLLRACCE